MPFISFGMHCYYSSHYALSTPTACHGSFYTDAVLDDVAIFTGAKSASEVSEIWNVSLTKRIDDGNEPNLAIFYDFNDPFGAGRATALHLCTALNCT